MGFAIKRSMRLPFRYGVWRQKMGRLLFAPGGEFVVATSQTGFDRAIGEFALAYAGSAAMWRVNNAAYHAARKLGILNELFPK